MKVTKWPNVVLTWNEKDGEYDVNLFKGKFNLEGESLTPEQAGPMALGLVIDQLKKQDFNEVVNNPDPLSDADVLRNLASVDEGVKGYHEALVRDSEMLGCLNACGVDNWSGYEDAQEMIEEE